MALISLEAGPYRAELEPAAGGSIASFRWHGRDGWVDIMRPATPQALASNDSRGMGCFPMVAMCGRISHNRFRFDGQTHELMPNARGRGQWLHGDGLNAAWTVAGIDGPNAVLIYWHPGAPSGSPLWPFRYRAEQRFHLSPEGLHVELAVVNEDERRWPAGMGLHPYFDRGFATRLKFNSRAVWLTDPEVLPLERVPVPENWRFTNGKPIQGIELDNCFVGWDGTARVEWPEKRAALDIRADPVFGNLVVYAPSRQSILCVEPASHAPGAVNRNRPDDGLRILEPGERLSGSVYFRAS